MLESSDYMAAGDYALAWGLYLIASFVVLYLYWRSTRRWQHDTRMLLLALLAVFLLTPAPVPGHSALAPAMIFVVLGGITGGAEAVAPVLVRLLLLALLAIVLVIIEGVWWRRRRRRAKPR